jgi:ribose/xylose/arabinose/galactoside ABC-type transport system permease subunit
VLSIPATIAVGVAVSLQGSTIVMTDQAVNNGIDFAGLAALITAVSGLVATVGALILATRRRSNDTEALVKMLLEHQSKDADKEPE